MEQRGEDARSHNPLSSLPNELFELVLQHATFDSIAALRRTSKANADRCMSPAFKAYYAHQTTNLSDASLARLSHIASHAQLAPAVTQLTVTAVCYDPAIWERIFNSNARDVELITKYLLPNIHTVSQLRRTWVQQSIETTSYSLAAIFDGLPSLRTLRLNARVVQAQSGSCSDWVDARLQEAGARGDVDWISLWKDCSRVLDMVTRAMARSDASIESLSVFDGCFGKVSSDRFHFNFLPVLQPDSPLNKNFMTAAAKLTTLNLGFSTRTFTPEELLSLPEGRSRFSSRPVPRLIHARTVPVTTGHDNVANFLKAMPHLETLSLYMYNTLQGHPVAYCGVIDHIADEVRLPNLRRLRLQGIWCDPDGLLRLLRAHTNITELDLRELHLRGPMSSWERIFGFFKQKMHGLSRVYLENLCYARGHLLPLTPKDRTFSSESDLSYPAKNPEQEPIVFARHISHKELQNGIELAVTTLAEPMSTRGRGGKIILSWIKQRHENYGPPRCCT